MRQQEHSAFGDLIVVNMPGHGERVIHIMNVETFPRVRNDAFQCSTGIEAEQEPAQVGLIEDAIACVSLRVHHIGAHAWVGMSGGSCHHMPLHAVEGSSHSERKGLFSAQSQAPGGQQHKGLELRLCHVVWKGHILLSLNLSLNEKSGFIGGSGGSDRPRFGMSPADQKLSTPQQDLPAEAVQSAKTVGARPCENFTQLHGALCAAGLDHVLEVAEDAYIERL
jgi:hypothetical protein